LLISFNQAEGGQSMRNGYELCGGASNIADQRLRSEAALRLNAEVNSHRPDLGMGGMTRSESDEARWRPAQDPASQYGARVLIERQQTPSQPGGMPEVAS
jgi:hypothetical protein